MRPLVTVIALLTFVLGQGQEFTGTELLNKAIEYHDPNGAWGAFHAQLSITMETPDKGDRVSEIVLNLPTHYFELKATRDGNTISQVLDKGQCALELNGSDTFSEKEAKTYGLNCERASMMKNYYTYLYGLPMKLKDPGTIIDPTVQTRKFKGKEYLVLKVTYKEPVGGDTWYFYFDPATYAMEVYQFYHDESKNDGEYILLSEKEEVSGIKMPKTRAWYYNKDDKYLGTDNLTGVSAL